MTVNTPTDNPDNIQDLTKTVTRIIYYFYGPNSAINPYGEITRPYEENVKFTRDATYDNVTRTVTYGS